MRFVKNFPPESTILGFKTTQSNMTRKPSNCKWISCSGGNSHIQVKFFLSAFAKTTRHPEVAMNRPWTPRSTEYVLQNVVLG